MDSVKPMVVNGIKLDSFTVQYLVTALWSSNDDSGNPLDYGYNLEDFSLQSLQEAVHHCEQFQAINAKELNEAYAAGIEESTAGHDFWLTRNHHGAGYWDGDYERRIGERLTKVAHDFGELTAYVGDDNQIYFSR